MTRIGINPARGKVSDYKPARVTVAMITYIPGSEGYFENRLRVLQLSLASIFAHTQPEHDILIFDNGSCDPVIDYLIDLRRKGLVDYLILSPKNIGKIGAFEIVFNAAPGEIIAYSDDDILFYPSWLEAQLDILEHFEQAGMVSGLPVRDAARHARQSLEKLIAKKEPGYFISHERLIPDEWEVDWANSTGRDVQAHLEATKEHLDILLRKPEPGRQIEAIGSANHFQFIGWKSTLRQALPNEWSGKLMGAMTEFDQAVDKLGFLRLSTTQRYTRHMGNELSPDILSEVSRLGLLTEGDNIRTLQTAAAGIRDKRHWLLRFPGARRIMIGIYRRIFDILYR